MIIRLPIDVKSLYFNIKNDNETGHTATVATPLKQYGGINEKLIKILQIPENINAVSREGIIGQILSKSRASAKINNVFRFDKISVNGMTIVGVPSFCIYVREETQEGYVHCGRQKVHYPTSLKYSDIDVEINNRKVIDAISEKLANYAFIVEAFEYNTETSVLNFDAVIVGPNGIPYSKVFINKRGTGTKFTSVFSEEAEAYDTEIIALREKLGYDNVGPDNFAEIMRKNKNKAEELVYESLVGRGATDIRKLSDEYPYALYDLQYVQDSIKHFLIVRCTSTKLQYFNLSINKIQFCNDFKSCAEVCLVTDINGKPVIHTYGIDIMNRMSKRINSISYENMGD